MIIHYTPFLKLKGNEIEALKRLDSKWHHHLVPFFDFPSKQDSKKPSDYADKAKDMAESLSKNMPEYHRFYIDTFDIEDHLVLGKHNYLYLLEQLSHFDVIPVTGPDRTQDHQESIKNFIAHHKNSKNIIAYRVTADDFASYRAIQEEIQESIDDLINDLFTEIHLIMDCRLVAFYDQKTLNNTSAQITDFIVKFTRDYPVTKVIISGSMIPVSLSSLVKANSYIAIVRNEMYIFDKVKKCFTDEYTIHFGDYTTVSPEFAEPNESSTLSISSKLIYPNIDKQHIWRGTKVNGKPSKGYLYNQHARDMIRLKPNIYRGSTYSWADGEFMAKQHAKNGFWTNTINKFLINAHISYMLQIYSR